MREMDAFEQAYKNGYAAGQRDAEAKIVYCKECRFFWSDDDNTFDPVCVKRGALTFVEAETYCSYGERRADNG